ncbi:MAG: YdbL family protein [Leptospirales bacterium]|nr:YdbL family protein [Leptospirales bacterium]
MKNLRTTVVAAFFASALINISACITIVPPKISMTGEKTVIERQITGEYMELESDAWVVSSIKTLSGEGLAEISVDGYDEELINAISIRNFHSDKIIRYKSEGAIGEAATGFILYRSLPLYEKQKAEKDILMAVIKNENDARLTIFKRSILLKEKRQPTQNEINSFGQTFAAEQKKSASQGDWMQDAAGKWTQK